MHEGIFILLLADSNILEIISWISQMISYKNFDRTKNGLSPTFPDCSSLIAMTHSVIPVLVIFHFHDNKEIPKHTLGLLLLWKNRK